MQNLFLIAFVVLVIVAIIHALHRYQLRERREHADRSAPLSTPPLSFADAAEEETVAAEAPAESESGAGAQESEEGGPWLWEIKRLRERGDFAEALARSRARHPRVQAYQQTLVTLRAEIKLAQRDGRSLQPMLSSLYRHAALADLFRHDSPCRPDPDNPLAPRLAALAAERLDLPWPLIGYRRLRLLTRTDIRLLTEAWGEPDAHRHAEEVEREAWRELEREAETPM